MKKVMITIATAFALAMSAGTSMAGPSIAHGKRGHAHDVRSSVLQARDHVDSKSKNHQTTERSGPGYGMTSQPAVSGDCQDACSDAYS
ncbi:hypothetical protein RUE5091_03318 [Ruegeria denitrificans]|uniref:Uncharacterized protein n=1 Tax=Ruegeria denitrificans TaxID=1715692 RepID=A0A0P1IFY9_9RHOB|nr:hypothetical protein [Ruegeria denitrificans]CUK10477.1 hypothetical protein RUE5091_03318 [Ruegeria denitrificans]